MSYFCDDCGNTKVSEAKYCFGCDYCHECCICNRPKYFNSKLTFHAPTRKQKKSNKTTRFISAEIEVAGIKNNKKLIEKAVEEWKGSIVYDGTLPPEGFEINTAPAGGDLYVKQITEICDSLAKAGAKVNGQCGLHVHLDARDFNYCDLHRLIRIYTAIEPALFAMVPGYRSNSIYSIPCADKLENVVNSYRDKNKTLSHIQLKAGIVSAVYGKNNTSARTIKRGTGYGTGRYYALNLHSWFFRGTIECRLFDGTLDKNEIIDWGVLWANILDFALHSSDDDISTAMNKTKPLESLVNIIKDNDRLKLFINNRFTKYAKASKKPGHYILGASLEHVFDAWAELN